MAIEKTVFRQVNAGASAAAAEMLTWLQTNANEYFTEIVSGDNSSVVCKIGDVNALVFYPSANNSNCKTIITMAMGTATNEYTLQKFPRAYKTNNGIAIFDSDHRPIFIVKDTTTDKTLILAAMRIASGSSSFYYAYQGFDIVNGSGVFTLASTTGLVNASQTYPVLRSRITQPVGANSLCPIIFGDSGAYNQGLFLVYFNNNVNSTETVIKIGDKQYVFDGAIALEE